MNKTLSVLLLVAVVSMCGCADVPYIDDGGTIDEYNEYIDVWNADLTTMGLYGDSLDVAIDDYNTEVEIYNRALFSNGKALHEAEKDSSTAKADYTYNGMIVKGHLESFRIFLYANEETLSRNGINVQQVIQNIGDWIVQIDYNIQFAGV